MSRLFFVFLTIFSLILSISPINSSANMANYPFQAKYPNIMMYQGKTHQKVVALTFDDGPDQRFTPKILDVLKKYHVKATFFLLGTRLAKYPNAAKRIVKEGHVVGNHTYWHPNLAKAPMENLKWEIDKTAKLIRSTTGIQTKWFRAPYGSLNEHLILQLGNMGYKGIGWSIDTEDWKELPAKEITTKVMSEVHPGAIILMHSAGHWTQDLSGTVKSLDQIIPRLKKHGYRFVTIPEMWWLSHTALK